MGLTPLSGLTLAAMVLSLAACAAGERTASAETAIKAPEVRVAGEPQRCIMRDEVWQSRVRSNRIIDFEMHDGRVYRVTLPMRCPGLTDLRAFGYSTAFNQLCSSDNIRALNALNQTGAECGLAPFVPVQYASAPAAAERAAAD